ncbi:MAG: type II secretion system protein [Planctomycetes bacterium]|nr:type II secretion system protein [Planctomycetota bacterium]
MNRQEGGRKEALAWLCVGGNLDMNSCEKNKGFSTLEVLAAVSIVIVLAAIVLSVGRRLQTQAEEKLAKSTIGILVTAIGQYHEFWNEFPVQVQAADPCATPALRSEGLYKQLYSTPNSKSMCEQIQVTRIADTDDPANGAPEFLDPWDEPLDYKYSPGDSFPVVISAGPDMDPCTVIDNISSKDM